MDSGSDRAVNEDRLVSGDVHVGDSPLDLSSPNLIFHAPLEGVRSVVESYLLLGGAIVEVSFLGKPASVNSRTAELVLVDTFLRKNELVELLIFVYPLFSVLPQNSLLQLWFQVLLLLVYFKACFFDFFLARIVANI